MLIYGERHLWRTLTEYARQLQRASAASVAERKTSLHEPGQAVDVTARVERTHVVKGLISEYRRAA